MSFLAPLFLIAGAAIAAPIVYHLIRRTTRDRVKFSSLMFLQPSPPRLSRRHRLEHVGLLLLRCAALVLLAAGFARPFFNDASTTNPAGATIHRRLLLVDVSASMRRANLWSDAFGAVEIQLRRAGPGDQIALFTFDRVATPVVAFDEWLKAAPAERVALAMSRLRQISPGWAATHLGNALVTAAESLGETDNKTAAATREIVLITDLQAGSRLDSLQAYEWPKGVALVVVPVRARHTTNAGVQWLADEGDSGREASSGSTLAIRARVTNSADAAREQFKLGWSDGATGGAMVDVYVPPGQSRVVTMPAMKAATGSNRLVLSGDDEDFDNTVYLVPPTQQHAAVLWLGAEAPGDSRQPLYYLRRAFPNTPQLAVQVVAHAPTAPLGAEDVSAARAVFVGDAVPASTQSALRDAAQAGQTVVVVLQNEAMAATLAGILGVDRLALHEVNPGNYAMLADIDFRHPLFAPFADPRFSDFTKIHFWNYRKFDLTAVPSARVLAKFDSGDAAIAEVPVGKGRVLVLATGWQPEVSQLAVSSKFVPLMSSLLELSGSAATVRAQWFVGDAVPLPSAGAAAVRLPDGTTRMLAAGAKSFDATTAPGVYEFIESNGRQPFVVNIDPSEARTAPLSVDELEHLGIPVKSASSLAPVTANAPERLRALDVENRQKLWRWCIAAAIAVLLVESVLAGRINRKQVRQVQEVAP
jgi:hypothetical protein